MELERERRHHQGELVRLNYQARDGKDYVLNLIDTPGHVDFAYEVSRSLSACEGSLLLVDASQGVEAQTLANVYLALENDHEIIPVLNKVDLPAAEPERVQQQIEDVIGLDASDAIHVSGKTGEGVPEVLEALVEKIPAPIANTDGPLKALLVDSWYDVYLGVVILVRVVDGTIRKGMKIRLMETGASYDIDRVGVFTPHRTETGVLGPGEQASCCGHEGAGDCPVGDTITEERKPANEPLPGFKLGARRVLWPLPVRSSRLYNLRESLAKLALNDASFQFETESSAALGFGFRCGFLGLLHLEIVQER